MKLGQAIHQLVGTAIAAREAVAIRLSSQDPGAPASFVRRPAASVPVHVAPAAGIHAQQIPAAADGLTRLAPGPIELLDHRQPYFHIARLFNLGLIMAAIIDRNCAGGSGNTRAAWGTLRAGRLERPRRGVKSMHAAFRSNG